MGKKVRAPTLEVEGLDGTVIRSKANRNYYILVDGELVEKKFADLKPLDVVASAEYIEKPTVPFNELVQALRNNSHAYKAAFDVLYKEIPSGNTTVLVTALSHILINGMYPELFDKGEVSSLEELTTMHAEGIESQTEIVRIVKTAIYDAMERYSNLTGTELSAANSTVSDWVLGNTMMSIKEGIYEALAKYDPAWKIPKKISNKPNWNDFFQMTQTDFTEAWNYVVGKNQRLAKRVRFLECVEVSEIPLEELTEETEPKKKDKSPETREKRSTQETPYQEDEFEEILPKIGITTPNIVYFVVKAAPKRTKEHVSTPRNIKVLEKLELPRSSITPATAVAEAAELRLILHEAFKHFLLKTSNEYGVNPNYDNEVFLASYMVSNKNVPLDEITKLNYDMLKLGEREEGINWENVTRYASLIEEAVEKEQGLEWYILKQYELRKEEELGLYGSISAGDIPKDHVPLLDAMGSEKYLASVERAYADITQMIDDFEKSYRDVESIFKRINSLQPAIPRRYIQLVELTRDLAIDASLVTPEDREMYHEFTLTSKQRIDIEERKRKIHSNLARDYKNELFPGVNVIDLKTI